MTASFFILTNIYFSSKLFDLHPNCPMLINELKSIELRDNVRVEIYQALHGRQLAIRNFCNQILFFAGRLINARSKKRFTEKKRKKEMLIN